MSRAPTRSRSPVRKQTLKRNTRAKKVSMIDRLLAVLPISQHTLQRVATWTIMLVVLGCTYGVATLFGVPAKVGVALAEQAGNAGFRLDQIEIRGLKRMDQMTVNAVAADQQSRAMPLVDIDLVRNRLLQYGWVKDAQVSRRLPNVLLIRLTERTPAAIWQYQGTLSLIDRDGVYLEQVSANAMPDLPLVIGPGADRQEPAYQRLMVAAPALKPRVDAATWVGNRRWDLKFDTGEILSLPEGDEAAATALRKFAEIEGTRSLLGKGWVKFDMRDTSRILLRKPDGSSEQSLAKPTSNKKSIPETPDRAQSRSQV